MVEPTPIIESPDVPIQIQTLAESRGCGSELRPADEEMKEEKEKVKDDRTVEEVKEMEQKSDPNENADIKCTEFNLSEWENVEVISVEPVQEYVDVNTHTDVVCESDNFVKLDCDISASEKEDNVKEEAVTNEEPNTDKEDNTEEELIVEEETDISEVISKENVEIEGELQEHTDLFSFDNEKYVPDCNISRNQCDNVGESNKAVESETTRPVDDVQENVGDKDDNDQLFCEVLESGTDETKIQQTDSNVMCDRVLDTSVEECNEVESQEVSNFEHFSGPLLEQQNEHFEIERVENQIPAVEFVEISNVKNDDEQAKPDNNINLVCDETMSVDKTPEPLIENNFNESRYDVEMTSINDPLSFVNEETSMQVSVESQIHQELSNNQDSMDSQSNMKEETLSYSGKSERELDLQETASNIQSQDSQDTRPDEDFSCSQGNGPQFVLPVSEVCVDIFKNCLSL